MNKIFAFFQIFRVGSELANPEAWKAGHITGTMVAALILALAHFGDIIGIHIPIDQGQADTLGAAVLIVANIMLIPGTSKKVGLLPGSASSDDSGKSD